MTFAEVPTGNCESNKTKRESVLFGMKRGVFEEAEIVGLWIQRHGYMLGIWLSSDWEHVFGSTHYSVHKQS